jgi:poly(A) polymerase
MIRLLKFEARLGFEVDAAARQALFECRSDIVKSSQARILEELLRMLESGHSEMFIRKIAEHGILQLLLPAISEFLETEKGELVYQFLKEADYLVLEKQTEVPDRAVLLSSLIFPILNAHLQKNFIDLEKPIHLGEIEKETMKVIHDIFHGFFHFPRRIKGKMITVLVSQYRITPFFPKSRKTIRVPNISEFHLALDFFYLRCRLEPGLQIVKDKWVEALKKNSSPEPKKRRRSHA